MARPFAALVRSRTCSQSSGQLPDLRWCQVSNGTALAVCITTMKVLCAWCCSEGKPGYLGERESLEDLGPTHGICVVHMEQVLEALPSRSFPDAELLVVVRRKDSALYEHLQRRLAGVPGVRVIVDRRVGDRRSAQGPVTDERRGVSTRRIRKGASSPLGGYRVVRFTPKVTTLTLEQSVSVSGSPHPI